MSAAIAGVEGTEATQTVWERMGEIAVIQSVDGKWIVGDGGGWFRRWDDGWRKDVYAGL
jgi:hypothetical protein